MRSSHASVLALGLAIPLAAWAAACSAPDPDAIHWAPRYGSDPGTSGADTGTAPPPGNDAGTRPPGNDASTPPPPVDASTGVDAAPPVDAPPAINAFTNAGTYASQPVATSAQQEHINRGIGTVPTGNDCLGCHNGTTATQFGFAGTIYTSAAATTGASDVELRVVDSAGNLYGSAHSDVDGDFWLVDNAAFPGGAFSGARNATTTDLMPTNPPRGGCNGTGCHDANQRLHIP